MCVYVCLEGGGELIPSSRSNAQKPVPLLAPLQTKGGDTPSDILKGGDDGAPFFQPLIENEDVPPSLFFYYFFKHLVHSWTFIDNALDEVHALLYDKCEFGDSCIFFLER